MTSDRVCSVEGCDEDGTRQGLCNTHYKRMQRYGSPTPGRNMLLLAARPDWYDQAACRGKTELFFPPLNDADCGFDALPVGPSADVGGAVAICATCPVIHACRDAGRKNRERGIWGGETEGQRLGAGHAPTATPNPTRQIAQARSTGGE